MIAVRVPAALGSVVKVIVNWVAVALVTVPVPLLRVTVLLAAMVLNPVPAIVRVGALLIRLAMLDVIVGIENATIGMLFEEKGLVQPVAPCR